MIYHGGNILIIKNSTVLAIFIIGLLAIGIASAADNSTNDVTSVENTIDDRVSVEDAGIGTDDSAVADDSENGILSSSLNDDGSNDTQINKIGSADVKAVEKNDDEILQADETANVLYVNGSVETSGNGSMEHPFKTLAEAIGAAQAGYTIKIAPGEYTGSNNTNLQINNPLNFERYGDGEAIFDAHNSNRIWTVNATSININGLTFKNGKEYKGAAIKFERALSDSFINVTAINNNATCEDNQCGAIYFNGALTNVTVTGNFINNTARSGSFYSGGAAIYFNGALTNVTVSGNFLYNTFMGGYRYNMEGGGAIFFFADVVNSNINASFINNTAFGNGGAIYVYGNFKNSNIKSTFINNTIPDVNMGGGGAAIYFYKNIENSIINSTFINNSARSGGATYFNNKLTNVTLTGRFIDNTAFAGNNYEGGGANYFYGVLDNVNISGDFIDNTITNHGNYVGGGVNYFRGESNNVAISGNFIKNYAPSGGVNYFNGPSANISLSGNYRSNTANFGSASFFYSSVTGADISGVFIGNDANNIIYISDPDSGNIIIHDSVVFDRAPFWRIIMDSSESAQIIDNWFGNTANDYNTPKQAAYYLDNWLFLNATANSYKIGVDEISGVTFKLQSYNKNGSISEYNSSKICIKLDLSQQLGEINQSACLLDEEISYTAKQKGDANVTAKFETASYTINFINIWGTLVVINNIDPGIFNTTATAVNYTVKFESEITGFAINKTDGTAVVYNNNIEELNDELFKLDIGNYTITLFAAKDGEVYNATGAFTVCRASSSIIISPIADVVYGENSVINFTVVNSTQVSWEIIDLNTSIMVDNGTGLDNISNAYAVGRYSITVTNALGYRYNASSATMNFTVIKADSIVNIEDIGPVSYGNDVVVGFNVTHPSVVTYVVEKDGNTVENGTIADVFDDLVLNVKDVGDYTVTIANAGNESYNGDVKSKEFSIVKAKVTVNVVAEPVIYGNNVIVNVTGSVAGEYSVTVNGITKNAVVSSPGEFASLEFGKFAANKAGYSIFANYTETDNYTGIANTTEIAIVNKAASLITIDDIATVVYGNDVTVRFGVENRSSVTYLVEKDGKKIILESAATDVLVLADLDAGDYVITISNAETENYSADIKSKEFRVDKIDVAVYVAADSISYGSNVIVNVTGDVAGEYSVTVNGITKQATVTVPGVFVSVDFGILPANETGHVISANYIETANYAGIANTTEKVIVKKAESLVNISSIDTVVYGGNVTVRFEITNLTEVSYTVKTDDGSIVVENVTIADAGADLVISGIGAGDYVVIIINAENVNYTSSSAESQFKVLKADLTIEPDVTSPRVADGQINATFTLPAGIDGTVTVSVDGVNVSLANVSNVYTAVLPGLAFGNHTVTVNLVGDSNYNDAVGNVTFNVKFGSKIVISDIVATAGKTITANVIIDGVDATGSVNFSVNGKDYKFDVIKGKATVKLPGLAAGKYGYVITYSGDGKYSSSSKTGSLTVKKPATKTTLTLKKVKVKRSAKKLTIQATLKINGKGVKSKVIKFKFNKKTYKARTNSKGVAKITVKKSVLKKLKKGKKVTYTASYGKKKKKVTVKVK